MPCKGLLQSLDLDPDTDPVPVFQELAHVNLELKRRRDEPSLILRKAKLEMRLGNHQGAISALQPIIGQAGANDPSTPGMVAGRTWCRARYRLAAASLAMALQDHGILAGAVYQSTPPSRRSRDHWMDQAVKTLECLLAEAPDDIRARMLLGHARRLASTDPRSWPEAMQAS